MQQHHNTESETIQGTVGSVIYSSQDSGYTVCEIEGEDGLPVVIVGTLPYIGEGDIICATGKWTTHPTYGRQFRVETYEKQFPTSKAEILRYLSSGAIAGIGPKTAARIVEKFEEDTFEVLEFHPEWLAELPGISRQKADKMSESFIEKSGARNVMMFCADFFGTSTSMKIYKKWGGRAIEMIRSNPYRLCDSFSGIGFRRADAIAKNCGIAADSDERIAGGLSHILTSAAFGSGHTCLQRGTLIQETAQLLSVADDMVSMSLDKLLQLGKLFCETRENIPHIYLPRYHSAEVYCASKLIQLHVQCPKIDSADISAFIDRTERMSSIRYAKEQRQALTAALDRGVLILTGGPGTGKTTIIKGLISIFSALDMDIALAAPTGRAAKRMSEATGCEAKTIHRLLEMEHNDNTDPLFARNASNYLDEDVIIIDESSMIDILLLEALLRAVKPGARVIFIGDVDQLPSVGAGNVLADLIDCDCFSTVRLTEIFRQDSESMIILNAHAINEGRMPDISNHAPDFFFLSRDTDASIANTVADLVKNRLPKAYGTDFAAGIQVITPSRKGAAGTEELNLLMQSILNPPAPEKSQRGAHGVVFRDGDRVMQIKNNYSVEWVKEGLEGLGIFNGDIGEIDSIDASAESMLIDFDGRMTDYAFSQLEELEHAYAITVHKSQGSEYPVVILPLYNCAPMLLTRNLLYTAVTRASKMVILVGRKSVLTTMVENDRHAARYTGLKHFLKG